jgi:Putative prokaryotic signal transducing protein
MNGLLKPVKRASIETAWWGGKCPDCRATLRKPGTEPRGVHELVRTNNAVVISAIGALLDEAGIPHFLLDQNMSVLEGSIGILPCRIMVAAAYAEVARTLLADAGFGRELRPDAG